MRTFEKKYQETVDWMVNIQKKFENFDQEFKAMQEAADQMKKEVDEYQDKFFKDLYKEIEEFDREWDAMNKRIALGKKVAACSISSGHKMAHQASMDALQMHNQAVHNHMMMSHMM